jgi:hypothetical protein
MTEIRNMGQEVRAEILKTARRSQDAVIEAIRTWADTVRTIAPPMPELSLPLRDKLPKPEELVGNAYDFAEKLLASQRKFAEEVLRATASVLPGGGGTGTKKNTATK